ncbi:hypothetical protein, partial [Stieleria mannarensis]|uniref:hypothetical protein n=1 Tax=Stieleria mannarensis TaxID=2755585 RepID=UPI0016005F48
MTIASHSGMKRRRKRRKSRKSLFQILEPRVVLDAEAENVFAYLNGVVEESDSRAVTDFLIDSDGFLGSRGKQVLGFKIDPLPGSQLNPASAQIRSVDGALYPLNYHSNDIANSVSSLIVAELPPGQYSLEVGGENQTVGSFRASVSLVG